MIIFENKYSVIGFEKEYSLITVEMLPATEDMTVAEFKDYGLKFLEIMEKYRPEKELYNTLKMKFLVVPEIQKWIAENINNKVGAIIKKVATIMPAEFFANVSIEQTLDESDAKAVAQKFFDNVQDARKWLLEN